MKQKFFKNNKNNTGDGMAAKSDKMDSVIGEDSVFQGRFHVDGSLEVNGKFEGEVQIDDQLIVGESGKIKTNVYARRVVVGGIFIGNIHATEEVVLLETGKVLGNIITPNIIVHKGVVTLGQIQITSNKYDGDGIKQIIEESFQQGPAIPALPAGTSTEQALLPEKTIGN